MKPTLDYLSGIAKDEKMPFNQFLSILGRTYYWNNEEAEQYNYELGLQYQQIFNGKNPFEDCKLSIDQGIYLLQKLEIGKMRYRDMKKFLSEFCHLPGYEKLSERIKTLMPDLISSENGGIWTNIKDILTRHLSATIEFLSDYDEDSFDFTNLQTKWTLGYGRFFLRISI